MDIYNAKRVIPILREIDQQTDVATPVHYVQPIMLICLSCAVVLLLLTYTKNSDVFHGLVQWLDTHFFGATHRLDAFITQSTFRRMLDYAWWTAIQLVSYIFIPWAI